VNATQLRDYRIIDGELDRFVREWRTGLAPLRRDIGFSIPAAWSVPNEGRFVWLLAHPGDWAAFEEADRAYFASPRRAAITPDPARLIAEQRTIRLEEIPLPWSSSSRKTSTRRLRRPDRRAWRSGCC
jgi:hypothetical protein